MLIPLEKIKQLYSQIIDNALQSEKDGCTTYILVSNDTDAICALRILTTILKSDEVQFVIIPVFSATHMRSELLKLKKHQAVIRSLIFLNCGGILDITREWFYDEEISKGRVTSYIFDSHRPYSHLNVIDDTKRVYVVHDGCKSFDECPTWEDHNDYHELVLKQQQNSDSEDDSDDLSDDSSAQENGQEGPVALGEDDPINVEMMEA